MDYEALQPYQHVKQAASDVYQQLFIMEKYCKLAKEMLVPTNPFQQMWYSTAVDHSQNHCLECTLTGPELHSSLEAGSKG